jgi:hypothetical protein
VRPSACWFETSGEMGAGRFWRMLGIPLAVARLLAIEEDSSRALDLPVRGSLGGPSPSFVSGDADLFAVSAAVAMAVASLVAARGSTSSGMCLSCWFLLI